MSSRRSSRSQKPVNYSKFSKTEDGDSDDDDFMETTPPTKKKKEKRGKERKVEAEKQDPANVDKKSERKSRNRLSVEEKYEKELQLALKMSLGKTSAQEPNPGPPNPLGGAREVDDASPLQSGRCQVIEADVLNSPTSKSVSESTDKAVEAKKIINGAAISVEDVIRSEPENNKETNKRKSGRSKQKIQEEEEYEMSDFESDSEENASADEISEDSDYESSPVKKPKKPLKKRKEKPSFIEKKTSKNKTAGGLSTKAMPAKAKPLRSLKPATPIGTSPRALPLNSPSPLSRSFKLVQSGWTPPGPAGSKSKLVTTPKSPSYIRVGLSRNARVAPLHSKVGIRS